MHFHEIWQGDILVRAVAVGSEKERQRAIDFHPCTCEGSPFMETMCVRCKLITFDRVDSINDL